MFFEFYFINGVGFLRMESLDNSNMMIRELVVYRLVFLRLMFFKIYYLYKCKVII